MSKNPPIMNAKSIEKWESDRSIAKTEIIDWLSTATSTKDLRSDLEEKTRKNFEKFLEFGDIRKAVEENPEILTSLRALTRRDIGTSQISTFLNVGTITYESIEKREKPVSLILENLVSLFEKELDDSLAAWIIERRMPSEQELSRSVIVASDRILKRSAATELRYKHEPRQLGKLKAFLDAQGYSEVNGTKINSPQLDMKPATYAFRVNIDGTTVDGVNLKQNVDTLIMPKTNLKSVLPIFLEAKSMTDEVNPNKRQKEEAQKVDNVRRRWQSNNEKLNFVLLLGGTVPKRYLEVEAGSGLDWIWEHRIEDLKILLNWYLNE